ANTLIGYGGNDVLVGGKGDDVYMVDDASDKVVESIANGAGGGYDTVVAYSDYSIADLANIDRLRLAGNATHGARDGLDNTIEGQYLSDDVLDGGKGADRMEGYSGNDTYYVDNVNDFVFEAAKEGEDTIHSTVALGGPVANVEDYVFQITTALNFTGTID